MNIVFNAKWENITGRTIYFLMRWWCYQLALDHHTELDFYSASSLKAKQVDKQIFRYTLDTFSRWWTNKRLTWAWTTHLVKKIHWTIGDLGISYIHPSALLCTRLNLHLDGILNVNYNYISIPSSWEFYSKIYSNAVYEKLLTLSLVKPLSWILYNLNMRSMPFILEFSLPVLLLKDNHYFVNFHHVQLWTLRAGTP